MSLTPESIIEVPRAALWQRVLGALIDGVVGLAIFELSFRILGTSFQELCLTNQLGFGKRATFLGLYWLIWLTANEFLLFKRGQTIGKFFTQTRIVGVNGQTFRPVRLILLRYLLGELAAFFGDLIRAVINLVNVILVFRKDRRCWHDRLAGTMVVKVTKPLKNRIIHVLAGAESPH